jgi:transposase
MEGRKRYTASFKSKVALEAIRGDKTLSQLAAEHGIHQTQIATWKRQATEGIAEVFSSKKAGKEKGHEHTVQALHAKIGQLLVEKDFLQKAFGRR